MKLEIKKLVKKANLSAFGSIFGLMIVFVVATIITQGDFLRMQNMLNVFRQVTILGFAALGMSIVIITGNIDLSIIGNVSMTTVITAVLMQRGFSTPMIILIVLLSGMLVGVVNGLILNFWKIESFVVTMGMQVLCFGMALLISDSRTVIVDGLQMLKYPFLTGLSQWRLTLIPGVLVVPIMFVILLGFYVIMFLFTSRTKMGRYIFALGGNEEVSYISGVNVNTVRLAAYVLSGMFAAIAGIFMFSRSVAGDPTAGSALGMYVVAAVVVGGTKMSGGRGSVLFTIIGIFIIGSINNILNLINAPYQFQQIVQGIIIIAAVVISSPRRR